MRAMVHHAHHGCQHHHAAPELSQAERLAHAERACIARGLPVTCLPGPSAVTTALVLSGLPSDRFCFEGFLPRKGSGRSESLAALAAEPRTMVLYEAPHRLARTLADLAAALGPGRRVTLARELTKLHEEIARGTLGELSRRFRDETRGEIVVVIGPASETGAADIGFAIDALRGLVRAGARPRAAASVVSALTGVPANELYRGLTGREPRR